MITLNEKTSKAQLKASAKYNKMNTKNFPVKVNKKTERDIYDHLEKIGNVNRYIKTLIKADIER